MAKNLNVGCGQDVKQGWVNLDSHNSFGVDLVYDLNDLPLPFETNHFDHILCSHVLEDFVNPIPLLDELVRILKVSGTLEIRVPYETNAWSNMNHQRCFSCRSFTSYCDREKDYGVKKILTVDKFKFYPKAKSRSLGLYYGMIGSFIYNLLPINLVDSTPIKYLFPCVFLKVYIKKSRGF